MEQFCATCGQRLGPDGRCPHCGGIGPANPAPTEKKKRKRIVIFAGIVLAALLIVGAVLIFKPFGGGTGTDPVETLARPAPEDYLSEFGSVTGQVGVRSARLLTEAEADRAFEERGFTDVTVITCYDDKGTYLDRLEITRDGTDQHPYYEASYLTPDQVFWTVTLMGDVFFAAPTGYNLSGEWDRMHMVSESGTIRSYDNRTNTFYTVSPDASALFLKQVARIDAETLDEMDAWEVDQP